MSGQFKVGEVLIGVNIFLLPQYNGIECVVIGGLEMRKFRVPGSSEIKNEMRYRVQWADGLITATRPDQLRRKEPPSGEQSILRMFTQPMPQKEIA